MSQDFHAPAETGWHVDTLAVRQALPRSQYGEHSEALYLTSSFVQPDSETSAHNFAHPADGYTYTRTANPTVTSFEQRLAAMEGAEAASAPARGRSAVLLEIRKPRPVSAPGPFPSVMVNVTMSPPPGPSAYS